MLKNKIRRSTLAVTLPFTRVYRQIIRDEAASGKFLLAAVALALLFMNSPFADQFEAFWNQKLSIKLGGWELSETLRHWVDEGLMTIFFLVAGLEIKRQIVKGELRTLRSASVPIVAAISGMMTPAILYALINVGQPGFHGWGVPMATDIAIAVGVLSLLGNRIPATLTLFLLTLAVVDDIGAIMIIALVYSQSVNLQALVVGGVLLGLMALLQWIRLLRFEVFILLGAGLWLAMYASGIHAAIAGALIGLSAPIVSRRRDSRAIAGRLERALIPVSAFVVVPLFALANAGVTVTTQVFGEPGAVRASIGIIAGLVLGKMLGIVGASFLLVKFTKARLPKDVTWRHMTGVGLIAGIGFTLSIFISELAYDSETLRNAAKMSIFVASIIGAVGGLLLLGITKNKPDEI